MAHRVDVQSKARREVDALPADYRRRLIAAIAALADEPRPRGTKKLKARADWGIRIGPYRVVYSIFDGDQLVVVTRVTRRTTTTYD